MSRVQRWERQRAAWLVGHSSAHGGLVAATATNCTHRRVHSDRLPPLSLLISTPPYSSAWSNAEAL